jgi:chemotaxis protein CheC
MALNEGPIVLSEVERDAIAESFNIGMGVAASALSEMVGSEVALSVPDIQLVERAAAQASDYGQSLPIAGVREDFAGPMSGHALLLIPEHRSLELVRVLLKQQVDLDYLTEMEQDALVEVGNIILNSCLGSIANMIDAELCTKVPRAVHGKWSDLVQGESSGGEDVIMQLRMDFSVEDIDVSGYIAFLMDIDSIGNFRRGLSLLTNTPLT